MRKGDSSPRINIGKKVITTMEKEKSEHKTRTRPPGYWHDQWVRKRQQEHVLYWISKNLTEEWQTSWSLLNRLRSDTETDIDTAAWQQYGLTCLLLKYCTEYKGEVKTCRTKLPGKKRINKCYMFRLSENTIPVKKPTASPLPVIRRENPRSTDPHGKWTRRNKRDKERGQLLEWLEWTFSDGIQRRSTDMYEELLEDEPSGITLDAWSPRGIAQTIIKHGKDKGWIVTSKKSKDDGNRYNHFSRRSD